ncbi:hypothetical protein [Flavobacterium croceum]|uniref:hypothetical protein n=1 Tax=Flavobacterium croceum TaxID=370975 RepID=UPI0024A864CD|nr:hypothetical protein [Flavobacterium croceum]
MKEINNKYSIDKFQIHKLNSKISALDIDTSFVIYFDCTGNNDVLNSYINDNYKIIKSELSRVSKNFIQLRETKFTEDLRELIKFYVPYFDFHTLRNFRIFENQLFGINESIEYYIEVFKAIGYNGNIKSGFIFFENSMGYVISYSDEDVNNDKINPLEIITNYFTQKESNVFNSRWRVDSKSDEFETALYKNLDTDAVEKIETIKLQLAELKTTGQLLFVLPILKRLLEEKSNEIDFNSVSRIHIDEDYNISLPYFDNLEVKLSHLTKVVYLLFYNNPKGIYISELWKYKEDLKNLYTNISNQLDFDKMMVSIEDLVNPNSKSIYTHISRIKSAFYKLMDKQYADYYIVKSDEFGNDFKYIPIIKPSDDVSTEMIF